MKTFQKINLVPSTAVIAAGDVYSVCTRDGGQLYIWDKVKPTSDN